VIKLDDDKYRPRTSEELASDRTPVTLINERVPSDNVRTLVPPKQRSLHVVLCEALINTQALLQRLELGVQAPPGQARVTVRELYVQTRRQLKVLAAVLELEGLE
jgi:hypothetical protein